MAENEVSNRWYALTLNDYASATLNSTMNMFTGNNDHSEIRVQNCLQAAHSADWSEYVREKLDQFAWQQ